MTLPVPVDETPLPVTDEEIIRSEALLAQLVRLFAAGTTGAADDAPAVTVPSTSQPDTLVPVIIDSAEKQLFYLHQVVNIVRAISTYAIDIDDVSTIPGPNLIPQARPDGTLNPGWIGSSSGGSGGVPDVFTGLCSSSILAGDLVYVSGPSRAVSKIDITNSSKIPCIGVVVSKPTPTTCLVQTSGIVENVFSGLTPNATYFVAGDGRPTKDRPHGSASTPVFVMVIGNALDATTLLFRPTTVVRTLS